MLKTIFPAIIAILFLFGGCSNSEPAEKQAKYVFYFIGDGASLPQLSLTEAYLATKTGKKGMTQLNQSRLDAHGWFYTHSDNRFITGSAAAGTALATGHKTSINTIGMSPNREKKYKSIAYDAKKAGMKVGIISTVSINHATPAAFYANAKLRGHYYKIGQQLFTSGFDLFAGGGLRDYNGKNNDKPDLYDTKSRIQIIRKNSAYMAAAKGDLPLYFSHERLQSEQAMPYAIDKSETDLTLAQIVQKSTELLDNPNGFFMMIEGGKIDWSCHANDAATTIAEMIDYDNAIGVAMEFAKKHPDETLIIAIGDHETGGLTLGNRQSKYKTNFQLLQHQTHSFEALNTAIEPLIEKRADINEAMAFLEKHFGLGETVPLTDEEKIQLSMAWKNGLKTHNKKVETLYGSAQQFLMSAMEILNQKAGIGWTTGSHTGLPVVVHAHGAGAEKFEGILDNTDIPIIIRNQFSINSVCP